MDELSKDRGLRRSRRVRDLPALRLCCRPARARLPGPTEREHPGRSPDCLRARHADDDTGHAGNRRPGFDVGAQRSANRALARDVEESSLLTGRTLTWVRGAVLVVMVAAAVLYVADAFALWDEAHAIEWSDEYGDTEVFFGLQPAERVLLTGSSSLVPLWYPVFVVVRQLVLDAIAIGLALLIFSRRPHHWMAYVSTLFIVVAPGRATLFTIRTGSTTPASAGWRMGSACLRSWCSSASSGSSPTVDSARRMPGMSQG